MGEMGAISGTRGHPQGEARILVVDDDPDIRAVLEKCLASEGHVVALAESGSRALELLECSIPDIIILDVLMPQMDGFATCERIKSRFAAENMPMLVFMTALGDHDSMQRAYQLSTDEFLVKPFRREELLLRIGSLLRIRRLKQELVAKYEGACLQNAALLHAKKEAEALLRIVMHDLAGPLGVILLNAEYLIRESSFPEDAKNVARDIVSCTSSMQRTIANQLDLLRANRGELTVHPFPADITPIFAEAAEEISRRARFRRPRVRLDVPSPAPSVPADVELLKRVLATLLDNAVKHSAVGGEIVLGVRALEGGGAEVRVQDEGPPIPEGSLKKIEGRDLAFCRLIAEAHGGRMRIQEIQPRGKALCIELPGIE
ncbi:MAG: response regulator [Deltaproteobacteria bacterium]|nr:response regulator [Deltaproteobacteria bacterium]